MREYHFPLYRDDEEKEKFYDEYKRIKDTCKLIDSKWSGDYLVATYEDENGKKIELWDNEELGICHSIKYLDESKEIKTEGMSRDDFIENNYDDIMSAYNREMATDAGISAEAYIDEDNPINEEVFNIVVDSMIEDSKMTESQKTEISSEVQQYIDELDKQTPEEYSTLLYNNRYECLLDTAKQQKRAINKAFKDKTCRYSDSYLQKQLDLINKVIAELENKSKEENLNESKILNEDDDFLSDRDKEIFKNLADQEEDKTIYDLIQDRIGVPMSVGELNTALQSIFGKFNEVFLLANMLYDADIDEPQELVVWDDDDMYTITFDIKDVEEQMIEITDVNVE